MIGTHGSCSPYAAGRSQSRSHGKGPTCRCARSAASRNRLSSSASDYLSCNSNSDKIEQLYSQLGSIIGNNWWIKYFTLTCATPQTWRMALLATPALSQTGVQLYEAGDTPQHRNRSAGTSSCIGPHLHNTRCSIEATPPLYRCTAAKLPAKYWITYSH
jgi:hypothetical protein